jgi:AcrR family transcriptional regulator
VDTTRDRILSSAWSMARQRGSVDFTLAEVGRLAGISRQAVYLHFDNRAALLTEMARRVDHTSGFISRLAASRALPAREGFVEVLRLWFGHLPEILPIARALEAAAINGQDGSAAYTDRMNDWWQTLRICMDSLAERDELRDGWSVDDAADWAWAQTHPRTYDHLVTDRRWLPDTVAERIIESLLTELTQPPRPPATP